MGAARRAAKTTANRRARRRPGMVYCIVFYILTAYHLLRARGQRKKAPPGAGYSKHNTGLKCGSWESKGKKSLFKESMTGSISSSVFCLRDLLKKYALLWRVPESAQSESALMRTQVLQIDACCEIIESMMRTQMNTTKAQQLQDDVLSWGVKWKKFEMFDFIDKLQNFKRDGEFGNILLFTSKQIRVLKRLFDIVTEDSKETKNDFWHFGIDLIEHLGDEATAHKPSLLERSYTEKPQIWQDIQKFIESRSSHMPASPYTQNDPRTKRYELLLRLFRRKNERWDQLHEETYSSTIVEAKHESKHAKDFVHDSVISRELAEANSKIANLQLAQEALQDRLEKLEKTLEKTLDTKHEENTDPWLFGFGESATNPYMIQIHT